MVQSDDQTDDAGMHEDTGAWVAVKDAAAHLGVSVDTVKRRMKRGELEARRETIPQGFRWLVRVDPAKTEAVESPRSDLPDNRDIDLPPASSDAVVALRVALEARTAEVASLLASVERLSSALEHAEARLYQLEAGAGASAPGRTGSPRSDEIAPDDESHRVEDQASPASALARLADHSAIKLLGIGDVAVKVMLAAVAGVLWFTGAGTAAQGIVLVVLLVTTVIVERPLPRMVGELERAHEAGDRDRFERIIRQYLPRVQLGLALTLAYAALAIWVVWTIDLG